MWQTWKSGENIRIARTEKFDEKFPGVLDLPGGRPKDET